MAFDRCDFLKSTCCKSQNADTDFGLQRVYLSKFEKCLREAGDNKRSPCISNNSTFFKLEQPKSVRIDHM